METNDFGMKKIAITHDYLIDHGGAEKVLEALHEIYPQAPIFVAIVDKKKMGKFWKNFDKMKIRTSWFNYLPFKSKLISPLRFLLPAIWGSFDLGKYDLIIDSSSWAVTKGFKTRRNQVEISYCHTPPRYLYGFDTSRKWKGKWYAPFINLYAAIINRFMRIYDFKSAQKVDYFIANSRNVSDRIKKYYKKDSVVIYPPVELSSHRKKLFLRGAEPARNNFSDDARYYLAGGRLVAAKNFDLIIKACQKAQVKLKIFGSGILENELRNIAGSETEFLGKITDEELDNYYENALGFIAAQKDEDFGITTVEAQAAGCPVIAYRGGGYMETVVGGKTGIFFDSLTVDSIANAIKKFENKKFNKKALIENAKRFSKERFQKEIKAYILSHAGTS